jgi:hypothetical protein
MARPRPWAALLPTVVVLGLLVLVWAATTGPVRMLSESGRTFVFNTPPPTPTQTPSADPSTGTLREVTKDVAPQFHLAWLGDLIIWTLFLAIGIGLFLGLRWLWIHRWQPPEKPEEVEFDVLPDRLVEALSHDAAAQQAAVEEGDPRNGIVACWLRLQQVVADAGLPPRRSETSSEFVVRALHSLDLDPRAIGRLAALYREARFSEHQLGEDARTAARDALAALHAELRSRGAVT